MSRRRAAAVLLTTVLAVGTGCATKPVLSDGDPRVQVITTTGLLRDMAEQVGGDLVSVASIVPDGSDAHSHEPTLRDARNVVYADVAFSNYALLEEHNIIKTLEANLRPGGANVSLAEESVKYAAEIIPLIENISLDTVWLGLRAAGDGAEHGATRASDVQVSLIDAQGPGDVFAYLTGSFGDTDVYFSSTDGFDAAGGFRDDTLSLPADAHTHLSWAFSEPGVYELTLRAQLQVDDTSRPIDLATETFRFAVGVDPARAGENTVVLTQGHADITANLDQGTLVVRHDPEGGGDPVQQTHPADDVVIEVPARALEEVPDAAQFRFLGEPGSAMYQLPQAVLGKHVHGEIDPHLWQNVRNVMAYAQLIRDTLIGADPENAAVYRERTDDYLAELDALDEYVRETIAAIPSERRHLVTTHDAFGYLAEAYDIEVAGFVTPNPATEPSLAARRKLAETIRSLDIPAVFLEPNLMARSSTLTEVAAELGVRVCSLYGDSFDTEVTTYVGMMRANADSLARCLGGASGAATSIPPAGSSIPSHESSR